jgi:hypothetical protein
VCPRSRCTHGGTCGGICGCICEIRAAVTGRPAHDPLHRVSATGLRMRRCAGSPQRCGYQTGQQAAMHRAQVPLETFTCASRPMVSSTVMGASIKHTPLMKLMAKLSPLLLTSVLLSTMACGTELESL